MKNTNLQEYKRTLDFDFQMQGSFSLLSYAKQFSCVLNFSNEQKNKVLNEIVSSSSFEEAIGVFTRNFGKYVTIRYKNKYYKQ